jgi:hypothetical protein
MRNYLKKPRTVRASPSILRKNFYLSPYQSRAKTLADKPLCEGHQESETRLTELTFGVYVLGKPEPILHRGRVGRVLPLGTSSRENHMHPQYQRSDGPLRAVLELLSVIASFSLTRVGIWASWTSIRSFNRSAN